MQKARLVLSLLLLLMVGFILGGCDGSTAVTTPPVVPATPTRVAGDSLIVLPSATPATMPTPPLTASPTPVGERRWQCDPSGGVACFADLEYVTMLSPDLGWATSRSGVVLRYEAGANQTQPGWGEVISSEIPGFHSLSMVGPREGWAAGWYTNILHLQKGTWEEVPTPARVNFLTMLSPDEGWAVGDVGTILHYSQGVWQSVPSPTQENLTRITMFNPQEGWAIGWNSTILHYQDQRWEQVFFSDNEFYRPLLNDIEFIDPEEGWIVGETILHYQAGTWQEITPEGIGLDWLWDMDLVTPEEGWAVGKGGRIFHFQQGKWKEIQSPIQKELFSVDMVGVEEGWAVGTESTILHYRDGQWEVVGTATPPPQILTDVAWLEDGTGWAVGPKALLHYQDGEWQQVSQLTNSSDQSLPLLAIDMVSLKEGWAVGSQGTILHYTQDQWQLVSSPTTEDLTDVDMINEHEGWAVGWNTGILHYTNGEWQLAMSADFSRPIAIDMINENEGWVVDLDGAFLHYQNGTWEQISPIIDDFVTMSDIDMVDEQNGWAVGNHVFRYQDGKWHQVDDPPVGLATIAALSANEVWASGRGIIVHYQNRQWQVVDRPGAFPIYSIKMLNENEGWAVGEGILHYTNK